VNSLLLKPSAKACRKQHLSVNRLESISLRTQRSCKRIEMCRKRTFRRSRQRDLAIDDKVHNGLLPCAGLMKGVQTMSLQTRAFANKYYAQMTTQDIVRKGR